VKYTITPNEKWSNGTSFNGNDLLGWWLRARALRTVLSDGYRDIKTLSVSKDGDVVTAGLRHALRRLEPALSRRRGAGHPGQLFARVVVGATVARPYAVTSATSSRVVLTMNKHWPSTPIDSGAS